MFEYKYLLSLNISHPDIDPDAISSALGWEPDCRMKAGEEVIGRNGTSLGRKYPLSHWRVNLFSGQTINSTGSSGYSLSKNIILIAEGLQPNEAFLRRIGEEGGKVELRIVWSGMEANSTGVIEARALRLCGALGIDLLLDIYDQHYLSLSEDQGEDRTAS